MPKRTRHKSKYSRSKPKAHQEVPNVAAVKCIPKLKDKYIQKLKDYFMFSECMFYNKEVLSWRSIDESHTEEIPEPQTFSMPPIFQLRNTDLLSWTAFDYHKLIGQGSFGKGFIASLKPCLSSSGAGGSTNNNRQQRACLIKMIGARRGDDIQNHYSQLINERDSLIRLGGLWTPRLYASFIERKLAAVFVQEFIDGESITYIKKLVKLDNTVDIYPLLATATKTSSSSGFDHSDDKVKDIPALNQRQFEIVQFYMAELIGAIRFIHDRGVLHRDLKENNILLTCAGHLKLIDFGLAKRSCQHETHRRQESMGSGSNSPAKTNCATSHLLQPYISSTHRLWGNRYYAAPEYVRGEKKSFDDKGDYWAVGVIFFHLLFGCRPFRTIVRDKIKELSRFITHWQNDSFLQPTLLRQRCRLFPQLLEPFFSLICDEEHRLSDQSIDSRSGQWPPESWELFRGFSLHEMLQHPPPIKIPSSKRVYCLGSLLEASTISDAFQDERYTDHLDCPYFNYINPFHNEILEDLSV